MRKDFIIDLFYDLLYLLPMTVIAVLYGYGLLGFEDPAIRLFFTAFICTALILAVFYVKGKNRFFLAGLVFEAVFLVFIFQKKGTRAEWLLGNQWILWVFLACLVLFLSVRLMHRFIPAVAAFGVLLLAGLTLLLVFGKEVRKIVVGLAFLLVAFCAVEVVQHFWKKAGDTKRGRHLVFLSPFLFLIPVVTLAVKAPEEPYDWLFFRKIYARAVTFFDRSSVALFHGFGDSYEEAKMGFSEGGDMPGLLSKNTEDMFLVDTGSKERGNLYLSGKHFDTFDGHQWSQNDPSDVNAPTLDTIESYVAIYQYDSHNPEDYIRRQKVEINYRYFNSRYIFAPMKSLLTNEKTLRLFFKFRGNDLYSDVLLNFRYPYTVYGYKLNQDNEAFLTFMENRQPITAETWEKTMWLLISVPENREEYSYEVYEEYKAEMVRQFLPETEISAEAQEYLQEVTAAGRGDYEKLLLLEEALSEGEYTLHPGAIPEEIASEGEWLDYFLFENNRGYCSHYATAFVLLARAMGYPARYVQGFCVPLYEESPVTVTADQSHVWPEVYLENFGWVRFEPTPGIKIDAVWKTSDQVEQNVEVEIPVEIPIPQEEEELPEILPAQEEEEIEEEKVPAKFYIISAAALLLSILLFLLGKYIAANVRYDRADRAGKLRITFEKNRKILALLGFVLTPGETLSEFICRTEAELPPDALKFMRDYERVSYADIPVTTVMCMDAERSKRKLLYDLKSKKGIRSWIPRLIIALS